MPTIELLAVVLASVAATYAWRAFGVLLSGRVEANSELFNWIACVAYAMVAGLIMRIIVMPTGLLAQSLLVDRLISCALALAAFYASRSNLLVGVAAGVMALAALGFGRSVIG